MSPVDMNDGNRLAKILQSADFLTKGVAIGPRTTSADVNDSPTENHRQLIWNGRRLGSFLVPGFIITQGVLSSAVL